MKVVCSKCRKVREVTPETVAMMASMDRIMGAMDMDYEPLCRQCQEDEAAEQAAANDEYPWLVAE